MSSPLRTRHADIGAAVRAVALATVLAAVAFVPSSGAASRSPTPDSDAAYVRHLVFEIGLQEFAALHARRPDPWFDWSTDWCSAPLIGSSGRSFDFRLPCLRHDFAYRNTQLLDIRWGCDAARLATVCAPGTWSFGRFWNSAARERIDLRFRSDMRDSCRRRVVWQWPRCLAWAEIYFRAVRIAGGP